MCTLYLTYFFTYSLYGVFHLLFLSQSQALMSRELRAMKAQMQEMKEMIKMSFDMQLDIQRAIRQEVAAAIAANLGKWESFCE